MYRRSDHIAAPWPYYAHSAPGTLHRTFAEACEGIPIPERVLDPCALAPIVAVRYPFADRSLLEGVARVPWLASRWTGVQWTYHHVPEHGGVQKAPAVLARELHSLLRREIDEYVLGAKSVGILLSGGLDSRIVAGLLRELQIERRGPFTIRAYTWGNRDSRDALLASRIASDFGWDWHLFSLDASLLESNFEEMAHLGAFCAPFHLHAIPQLRDHSTLPEVVLAGSYGDSIGRAEFSGSHVSCLPPVLPQKLNRLGLFRSSYLASVRETVEADAYSYRSRIPGRSELAYREIERQMHYMRRMLHACMLGLEPRTRVEQMFTHPAVVSLMWGTSPACRTDQVYANLLALLPGSLDRLPWARTGRPLGDQRRGVICEGTSHYHNYGHWLRRDLGDQIVTLISGDAIRSLGIFDMSTIRSLIPVWRMATTRSTNWLDESFAYMATLARFVDIYSVRPASRYDARLWDTLCRPARTLSAAAYILARQRLRT